MQVYLDHENCLEVAVLRGQVAAVRGVRRRGDRRTRRAPRRGQLRAAHRRRRTPMRMAAPGGRTCTSIPPAKSGRPNNGARSMSALMSRLFSDDRVRLRDKVVGMYVLLVAANVARLGVGARRVPRLPGAARHGAAGLQLRPAPRVRRRPHRRHRQRHAQADAGGQAAGRRRLLLLARPFDHRGRAVDRDRGHRDRAAGPVRRRSRRSAASSARSSRRCSCSPSPLANIFVLVSICRTFQTVKSGGRLRRGGSRPGAGQPRPARRGCSAASSG